MKRPARQRERARPRRCWAENRRRTVRAVRGIGMRGEEMPRQIFFSEGGQTEKEKRREKKQIKEKEGTKESRTRRGLPRLFRYRLY